MVASLRLTLVPFLPCHPRVYFLSQVNSQFYSFRWITLLLTQDFNFADAVRIWDMLLSDPNGRLDCLLRLCCAMLLNVRQELLAGDFASNIKLLQRYPCSDVNLVLKRAAELPPIPPTL